MGGINLIFNGKVFHKNTKEIGGYLLLNNGKG
jgi:hypothetical protein